MLGWIIEAFFSEKEGGYVLTGVDHDARTRV